MSIKFKLLAATMTIFALFVAITILVSVSMINNAFETGQSAYTPKLLDLSVQLLRQSRQRKNLSADTLAYYESQAMAALGDYRQRHVYRDDLLKKLVIVLLLNALPFFILGYIAIVATISRTVKPMTRLTDIIGKYPDISPESLESNRRAGREIQMLTEGFRRMLETIRLYQDKLKRRSRVDGWMEMSRAIVHEVGNAITPAKNSADALKAQIPGNAHVFEVQRSIGRLEEVFRHVRQLYKSQAIERSPFDIVDELDFISRGFKARFFNRTGCTSLMISGSATECTLLFTNLIKNASEAVSASPCPEIAVKLSRDNRDLLITVSDNGCGISPEALSKIFSPGFSSKSNGFGIGLAIVEKIITLHEWFISVSSKPGEGTQFLITIPERDVLERTHIAG